MQTEITQYIVRGSITVLAVALSVLSIILLNHFRGSRFEKPIRFFTRGFLFIAIAKIVAMVTKFLMMKKIIPGAFKWVMSVYEVIGMTGLLIIILGLYCLLYGSCSGILTDSKKVE